MRVRFFELRGSLVTTLLILLTAVVGTLFIVLGPRATERSPGVVHIGIRYSDEMSLRFNPYGTIGPGATIEIVSSMDEVIYTQRDLQIGRNLMPLQDVDNGHYRARLSAPGYLAREIPIIIEGKKLYPAHPSEAQADLLVDDNLIGVRFHPKDP